MSRKRWVIAIVAVVIIGGLITLSYLGALGSVASAHGGTRGLV